MTRLPRSLIDRHDRVVQWPAARERRASHHRVDGALVGAEAERGLPVGAVAERVAVAAVDDVLRAELVRRAVVAVAQHRALVAVAVAGELEVHPEVLEHRNEALGG